VFSGAVEEIELTVKVPGPLKVAILQSPEIVKVLQAPLTDAHIKLAPENVELSS
jgi:hypothetical protein